MKKEQYYYFVSNPYCTDLSPEKMIECIDKAIKINPLPQYRIRKGEILFCIGEHYQEAIEVLKDVLEEVGAFDKAVKLNTGFIDRLVGGCRLDEEKRELIKCARHEINETRNIQIIKAGK